MHNTESLPLGGASKASGYTPAAVRRGIAPHPESWKGALHEKTKG